MADDTKKNPKPQKDEKKAEPKTTEEKYGKVDFKTLPPELRGDTEKK